MTREGALLVMIAVAVLLLGVGVIAWVRRTRRDSGLQTPVGEIPAGATISRTASVFYVATTRHDQPLERLAVRGLAFRSRAEVTVTDRGVALDLVGQPRLFLETSRIAHVELATVAIDRVVEPGGLVRLTWRAARADGSVETVDSFLRPQDGSARALADAIAATLPTPSASTDLADPTDPTATPTGTEA